MRPTASAARKSSIVAFSTHTAPSAAKAGAAILAAQKASNTKMARCVMATSRSDYHFISSAALEPQRDGDFTVPRLSMLPKVMPNYKDGPTREKPFVQLLSTDTMRRNNSRQKLNAAPAVVRPRGPAQADTPARCHRLRFAAWRGKF